jgi:hypothetical protein
LLPPNPFWTHLAAQKQGMQSFAKPRRPDGTPTISPPQQIGLAQSNLLDQPPNHAMLVDRLTNLLTKHNGYAIMSVIQ